MWGEGIEGKREVGRGEGRGWGGRNRGELVGWGEGGGGGGERGKVWKKGEMWGGEK